MSSSGSSTPPSDTSHADPLLEVYRATAVILREIAQFELKKHLPWLRMVWHGLEGQAAEAVSACCSKHCCVICCPMLAAPVQDDAGHARVIGLAEKKEELYLLRMEVQGFEGLVVEGMQELLRRKAVRPALLIAGCELGEACCEEHAGSAPSLELTPNLGSRLCCAAVPQLPAWSNQPMTRSVRVARR